MAVTVNDLGVFSMQYFSEKHRCGGERKGSLISHLKIRNNKK